MNRTEALDQDVRGEIYADRDETGTWLVLGTESGFCYASPASKEDAEARASELNQLLDKRRISQK